MLSWVSVSKKPKPNHPRQGSVRRKYQALAMGLEGQQYADYVYGNMQEFWLKYGEGRVPWDGRLAEVQETQYLYKLLAEAFGKTFDKGGDLFFEQPRHHPVYGIGRDRRCGRNRRSGVGSIEPIPIGGNTLRLCFPHSRTYL